MFVEDHSTGIKVLYKDKKNVFTNFYYMQIKKKVYSKNVLLFKNLHEKKIQSLFC